MRTLTCFLLLGVMSPAAITLESGHFSQSTMRAGETLVLTAVATNIMLETPLAVQLTKSSGFRASVTFGYHADCPRKLTSQEVNARVSAYESCTDEALTVAIADEGNGLAFIGFKETDAVRGIGNNGEVLVSAETAERMKVWLAEQGVSIQLESSLTPTVVVLLREDVELIATIRRHPNVDYIEPDGLVEFHDALSLRKLSAMIRTTSSSEAGLLVRPGAAIIARYQ